MHIQISEEAFQWFDQEMEVETGEYVQFFARYGGSSPLHEGFSLGVRKEQPEQIAVSVEHDGVTYYIDQHDVWFFQEHDLHITLDEAMNELRFDYQQA